MAIAFVTNDFTVMLNGTQVPGGCCYYRCSLPMFASGMPAKLGRPAFHPDYGFGIKESNEKAIFGFSHVVLKLIMFRWTPRQIEIAKSLGQKIFVDVDDAYDFLPESNAAFQVTDPAVNKSMNRDHYRKVIDAADTVIVSTPFLLKYHSRNHQDVRMVRNGIYADMFHVKRQSSSKPTVGWVGAVSFRGGDLETLTWLPSFLNDNDLMFHHSGDDPISDNPTFDEVVGIDRGRMTYAPLVPINDYPNLFNHFDIGIVPLSDIPFNHAKSCIKGLEYAAAGIPFVAAATPEYEYLASTGVGRVARNPSEWLSHMNELLDYRVRRKEAAKNRRIVKELHSIQARESEWQGIFNSSG